MISAGKFVNQALHHGFGLWTGVPCSYLKPFINYVIDSPQVRYIGAANEGDAVAIAAGAGIAGTKSIVMFQNSGLGNAVNPLTSLTYTFRIPVLVITTLRGEPGGAKDEPQHELMGRITTAMLETMGIPWEYFPAEESEIEPALRRAADYMETEQLPYALVMKKGSVAPVALQSAPEVHPPQIRVSPSPESFVPSHRRGDFLAVLQKTLAPEDVIVATTGFTGRELYAMEDRENQLYMVGSMGCASSFALGIALTKPDRRVYVLEGDGAVLMRMGALATIGYQQPANLTHILLDNQVHESTGGQSTVSHSVDFAAIAAACGYPAVERTDTPEGFENFLRESSESLRFLHVKVEPGVPDGLPRPIITPVEVGQRFSRFLK
ncbi:phosphonopyruvate decarboxylase [Marispirochaeta sp.]|uniref:phosphonopyruvate decarboxylase n=1 Tax=Marispirochaeta sp. TaxID=2038653 RepID=UPI0029C8FB95|nr:phosphonopyruvate decarboxylase [Marispirochaeta sp.]